MFSNWNKFNWTFIFRFMKRARENFWFSFSWKFFIPLLDLLWSKTWFHNRCERIKKENEEILANEEGQSSTPNKIDVFANSSALFVLKKKQSDIFFKIKGLFILPWNGSTAGNSVHDITTRVHSRTLIDRGKKTQHFSFQIENVNALSRWFWCFMRKRRWLWSKNKGLLRFWHDFNRAQCYFSKEACTRYGSLSTVQPHYVSTNFNSVHSVVGIHEFRFFTAFRKFQCIFEIFEIIWYAIDLILFQAFIAFHFLFLILCSLNLVLCLSRLFVHSSAPFSFDFCSFYSFFATFSIVLFVFATTV